MSFHLTTTAELDDFPSSGFSLSDDFYHLDHSNDVCLAAFTSGQGDFVLWLRSQCVALVAQISQCNDFHEIERLSIDYRLCVDTLSMVHEYYSMSRGEQ